MNADNILDSYPLSPMQSGMLFNSVSAPRAGTDIEQIVCTLPEVLDLPLLRRAWERVVERHPLFRTAFRWGEGQEALQVVYERASVPWSAHDWRALSREAQADGLSRFLTEDRGRGFCMSQAPLLRLTLFQIGDGEYQLVWTFHHALIDGRSFPVVLNEVFAYYESFRRGEDLELPFPKPYRNYIDWLQLQDPSVAEPYWRRLLEGFAAPTPLMVDKTSVLEVDATHHQGDQKVLLSATTTAALHTFARNHDLTLNTLLQGAWGVLLSRYSGEEDVVFGVVRSCRKSSVPGADEMVGLFINTLPMRVRTTPDSPLVEWLKQVRAQWRSMREYEHTPLAKIQKWSAIPLGSSLFASILMFDKSDLNRQLSGQGGDWAKRSFREYDQTGYPITLTVYDGTELCLQIEFDRALLDPLTITRMLGHLKTLLESMLAKEEQRVGDLLMLTPSEYQQLRMEWNDTSVPYPENLLLQRMFEEQVKRTPDRVAVEYEDRRLSYRELNQHANRLAHRLRAMGVGPDALVGVCMERSLELVVALYGILKAGGAYVPIDPEYPQERITFMLQDAGVSVLLTQSRILGQLHYNEGRSLCLDDDWGLIECEDAENLGTVTTSVNLAYMIYTSGSTGKPKGALNTHRGICNRLLWMQEQYRLTDADRVLQKTPFSFDVSVWEFFWPLSVGARLVVARPGGHRDASYLVRLIKERQITVLHFVPSMLRVFLEEPGVEGCQSLRDVICSGEALPYELQERFFELSQSRLHNLYGPTEAAVDVTQWACRRHDDRKTVPIGRPIANTQIYILDRSLQPVPVGVPGELYIGGVQVGRGYHNRPELTAERFVLDPFHADTGARLYRTGDLCRWLEDGAVEYLGRLDQQVKIRGCRIELGEIETSLGQHPAVQQAVVTTQDDTSEDKRLVACVIPNQEHQIHSPDDELHSEHIHGWETVFDEMYQQSTDTPDPTFDIVGWKSSYTGEVIPAEEMRTWVDTTAARILALRARDVWEIGCGTGLLLHRVAPHCAHYHATDASASVVEHLQRQIVAGGAASADVVVRHASAHDFTGIAPGAFDLVILNSVAQYFPSIRYLIRVLEGAVRSVKPGGAIFLGDIRNLSLLETFHASVQVRQAPSSLLSAELRRKIQTALAQESELAISPNFFNALQRYLPAISQVEIQLKRGHHRNELSLFRYDVVLRVGGTTTCAPECAHLDWEQDRLTFSTLQNYLAEQRPEALIVTQVPNERLEREIKAVHILATTECPATAGELREALRTESKSFRGVDPEDLWTLGELLGYEAQIRWSKADAAGSCDVVFLRESKQAGEKSVNPLFGFGISESDSKPWSTYGNNPLHGAMVRELTAQLRSYLRERLPDYMMPSTFVILEQFPLMPNGKLDRSALPLPSAEALSRASAPDPMPEIGAEQKIAEIWRGILGITRIGRDDNFFDLGGDSLRLTMVRSRLQRALDKEIDLVDLFRFPTIRTLAQHLAGRTKETSAPDMLAEEAAARKHATRQRGQLRQRLLQEARMNADEHAPGK